MHRKSAITTDLIEIEEMLASAILFSRKRKSKSTTLRKFTVKRSEITKTLEI